MVSVSPPPKEPFASKVARYREGLEKLARDAWEKARDMAGSNLALGEYHFEKGNFQDAVLRFRIVTMMQPKRQEAWFGLAKSYHAMAQNKKAHDALATLFKLNPAHMQGRALKEQMQLKKAPAPETGASV